MDPRRLKSPAAKFDQAARLGSFWRFDTEVFGRGRHWGWRASDKLGLAAVVHRLQTNPGGGWNQLTQSTSSGLPHAPSA